MYRIDYRHGHTNALEH